jgi:hypothetical protein
LQKNKKFESEDFDRIKRNISQIDKINKEHPVENADNREIMRRDPESMQETNNANDSETINESFQHSYPTNELSNPTF